MKIKFLPFLVILLAAAVPVFADDSKMPSWLSAAAQVPTPTFEIKNVPAVVLYREEVVRVGADGTMQKIKRYAVRVLTGRGKDEAVARLIYTTDTDKVRDMSAWLIRRGSVFKSYGKKETLDVAAVDNDLYNEARVRLIDGSDDAAEGDIFAYEAVSDEGGIFSQFQYLFQSNLPTLSSSFSLTLPPNWKAESITFNNPAIDPVINGSTYTWAMKGLPPINPEPNSPSFHSLAPRVAVSFYPTGPNPTPYSTFGSWNDVAKWMSAIEDPMMTIDAAMTNKAKQLTADAKTEWDKVKAISEYVQQIQYISIQVGTGRGGGYRPRSATEVFAKAYGDCKDKANLMRAMLHVVGVKSYMVSITADDPTFVRKEWASPHQFNHCIIAIKISDETQAPSVAVHPKLGRLLMFDPTDPYTPLGDLPEDEQGSYALIDHPETEELLMMPVIGGDGNRLDRTVEATLHPDGSIDGKVSELTVGQSARRERSRLKNLSRTDYDSSIHGWINRGVAGAVTSNIVPKDDQSAGKFNLDVNFKAGSYAQLMQGKLMVFKPAVIGRLERLGFAEGKRMNPYHIDAMSYSEKIRIKLPAGFEVDEIPDSVNLAADFGKYSAAYNIEGEYLVFSRSLKLERTSVPSAKYTTVTDFFGRVHNAEKAPVVLLKR